MTTFDQARAWREKHGWTRQQLAELIGYSPEAIYWAERGMAPPGRGISSDRRVKPWVWLRYQRACQGLDAEIRGVKFKW